MIPTRFSGLAAVAIALSTLAPLGAMAETQSQTVFEHKHWTVDAVAFDDGTLGCVAQVSIPGESFSIWVLDDQSVKLQFFSDEWSFDEGTADLMLQIDRREPWTLTEADLYQNSVLFTIPDSNAGARLVREVKAGNRLMLMDSDGAGVKDYSLAGSSASIDALSICADELAR